jgi:hypothetical protein
VGIEGAKGADMFHAAEPRAGVYIRGKVKLLLTATIEHVR